MFDISRSTHSEDPIVGIHMDILTYFRVSGENLGGGGGIQHFTSRNEAKAKGKLAEANLLVNIKKNVLLCLTQNSTKSIKCFVT